MHEDRFRETNGFPCQPLDPRPQRQMFTFDLRHTFASLLIQQSKSLAYVKEQMRHHSIRVTVDVYDYLVPGENKAAVDRLDGAVSENTVSPGPGRTLYGPKKAVV
jgi:hypothetical protein